MFLYVISTHKSNVKKGEPLEIRLMYFKICRGLL